jgi:hypothetical protein
MKRQESTELQILKLQTGTMRLGIKGVSPMIFHAMSQKGWEQLLLPRGKMTAADKATNIKHDPITEYRNSVYASVGDDAPTRLIFPAAAFKKAMMTAALRIPGMKKTEIGQLVWVGGKYVDVYGIPELLMSVVRSADINRTPDIRTRAIVPNWACSLSVTYVRPQLGDKQIGNLLAAAGMIAGVGDGRQEKGAMNFGQFEIVAEDDAEFKAIIKNGGRVPQDRALETPQPHDLETERMLTWYLTETEKMGDKIPAMKSKRSLHAVA